MRTIEELLGQPPKNLMDKTAASLRDMFTAEADFLAVYRGAARAQNLRPGEVNTNPPLPGTPLQQTGHRPVSGSS